VKKKKSRKASEFLPACHMPPGTWIVPVETVSMINQGRTFGHHIKFKKIHREAVFLTLGKNHHALSCYADDGIHKGRPIRITMTRLSPKELDEDNLDGSMKYVRDAIAFLLGTDDKNRLITWTPKWEKSKLIGVRIQMERK
jgi:hypothetical protein